MEGPGDPGPLSGSPLPHEPCWSHCRGHGRWCGNDPHPARIRGYARLSDSVGASSRLGTSSDLPVPRASCRHPDRLLDRYLRHRRARHDRVRVAVDQASDPVRIAPLRTQIHPTPTQASPWTKRTPICLPSRRRASSGPMGLDGSPHDDGMMKPHNDAVLGDRHPGRDDGIRPQGHGWRIEGPHRKSLQEGLCPAL